MTGPEDALARRRAKKSAAPIASCLICGYERPLGVWRDGTTIGVCEPCRDAARTSDLRKLLGYVEANEAFKHPKGPRSYAEWRSARDAYLAARRALGLEES